jgi:flagellar biosynthesis protein FliP
MKYVVKEINLLFFKCVQIFRHKSKGKGKKVDSSSSSQARSKTSVDLFAVMIFIYMSSFIITLLLHLIYFVIVFVCRVLWPPDTDRRPFLRL